MKYNPPAGSTDPDAPYVTGNAVQRIKGSPVPAEAVELPQREIVKVILEGGLTPSNEDVTQLYQAILQIIEDNLPQQDGLLDCSTAAATAAKEIAAEGFELSRGKLVRVAFAAVNTAADPTLNIGGTGAKAIRLHGGAPLPGDLGTGPYLLAFNGTAWDLVAGMGPVPVGQYRWFEDEAARPGYARLLGGTIQNFSTTYPQMAAYLASPAGAARLVASQAEYDALHTAVYYTNADGETEGWNGIGGVNKFFWDTLNDTLTLPDLAGMSPEQIGCDGLGVGGVREDRMRTVTGTLQAYYSAGIIRVDAYGTPIVTGPFARGGQYSSTTAGVYSGSTGYLVDFNNARVVPTGPHTSPRAWGSLACVYLGQPAS